MRDHIEYALFKRERQHAFLFLLLFFAARVSTAQQCGLERWPVKTATDPDATKVSTVAMPTTIEALRGIPAPRPLMQNNRIAPVETTIYTLAATLVAYRLEGDNDIHAVIADSAGRTMIIELPSSNCVGSSFFATDIRSARSKFDQRFTATSTLKLVSVPVAIRGIGFWDYLHGQTGVAPNGIELHPLLDINFAPIVPPLPPHHTRIRPVRRFFCPLPVLTMTLSKAAVCANESFTLSWQSSDAAAKVSIDGVGTSLPASGSMPLSVGSSTLFIGRAEGSCGTSLESAQVIVTSASSATASLTSSSSSITQNGTATLTTTLGNATAWSLSSSLGNPISNSSGTGSGTFTSGYSGSKVGTDTVTLNVVGSCGSTQRTAVITVSSTPPPPPPPPAGLQCCDGTRSPTCFSCANKQGCCSHHGGVCGCPTLIGADCSVPFSLFGDDNGWRISRPVVSQ